MPVSDGQNSNPEVLEPSNDEDDWRLSEEYEPRMDEVLKLANARAGYPCRESDLPKSFNLPPEIQEIVLSFAIAIKEGFGQFGRLEVTGEIWIGMMWKEPFGDLGIIDLLKYLRGITLKNVRKERSKFVQQYHVNKSRL
jgi:hypothetical protein